MSERDFYEVHVEITVARRGNYDDRMSLSQNFQVPDTDPVRVFSTLTRFSELAEQVKAEQEKKATAS